MQFNPTLIVTAPEPMPKAATGTEVIIFLAGPIRGVNDWQQEAAQYIQSVTKGIIVANPRRPTAFNESTFFEQIDWETYWLNKADAILFWMPKEETHECWRPYAQTTRFELGEWLTHYKHTRALKQLGFPANDIHLAIGMEKGFTNSRYLTYRINSDCPELKICDNLKDTCDSLLKFPEQTSE